MTDETSRAAVSRMREVDPTRSQASMAKELGISPLRVQQILIDLGLPLVYRQYLQFAKALRSF